MNNDYPSRKVDVLYGIYNIIHAVEKFIDEAKTTYDVCADSTIPSYISALGSKQFKIRDILISLMVGNYLSIGAIICLTLFIAISVQVLRNFYQNTRGWEREICFGSLALAGMLGVFGLSWYRGKQNERKQKKTIRDQEEEINQLTV